MRPLLSIGFTMNADPKKQKLAKFKQTVKDIAPAAIAFTAAAASVALVIRNAKKTTLFEVVEEPAPFRIVDGEEKETLLGRDDIVIQEADPGLFYFISVIAPGNPLIEN